MVRFVVDEAIGGLDLAVQQLVEVGVFAFSGIQPFFQLFADLSPLGVVAAHAAGVTTYLVLGGLLSFAAMVTLVVTLLR